MSRSILAVRRRCDVRMEAFELILDLLSFFQNRQPDQSDLECVKNWRLGEIVVIVYGDFPFLIVMFSEEIKSSRPFAALRICFLQFGAVFTLACQHKGWYPIFMTASIFTWRCFREPEKFSEDKFGQ